MHSPRAEWVLGIGYLGILDYLRSRGDADGDTLSECVRPFVQAHPIVSAGALLGGAGLLHRHLLNPRSAR